MGLHRNGQQTIAGLIPRIIANAAFDAASLSPRAQIGFGNGEERFAPAARDVRLGKGEDDGLGSDNDLGGVDVFDFAGDGGVEGGGEGAGGGIDHVAAVEVLFGVEGRWGCG